MENLVLTRSGFFLVYFRCNEEKSLPARSKYVNISVKTPVIQEDLNGKS